MCGNTDEMTEASRQQFLSLDQEQLIRKFSLQADEDFIYVPFLGKTYGVHRKLGTIVIPGSFFPIPQDIIMAIYDMLCFSSAEPELPKLSGTWQTLAQIGGIIGAGHARKLHVPSILKPFEGKVEELRKACEELGGVPAKGGDVSYYIPVFPFFQVWFQYWDADEEFPANIQFLWDKDSEKLVHFEVLYYTTAYMEQLFTEMINR